MNRNIVIMEIIIEHDNLSTIIDELTRDPHAFDAVDVLVFKNCHNLTYLPETIFENMTNLKSLNFDGCRSLVSIGDSLGNLTKLESLYFDDCGSLEYIPECTGDLYKLECFYVENCGSLQALPMSLKKLERLETACVIGCESLKSLGGLVGFGGSTDSLESLDVYRCEALQGIVDVGGQKGLRCFGFKFNGKNVMVVGLDRIGLEVVDICDKMACVNV